MRRCCMKCLWRRGWHGLVFGTAFFPSTAGLACEWHFDQYIRGWINVTDDPWHFDIDSSCTKLSCMTLLWGAISDVGAKALAAALEEHPQLEELYLGYNRIGAEGAAALAAALKHVPELRVLHLGWNDIGDAGAQALADSLEFVPKLVQLNLFWNGIGPKGTEAIAKAIHHTPRLEVLSLAWNDIGDHGASALATVLGAAGTDGSHTVPQLTQLRLHWSNIGDAGAEALAAALVAGQHDTLTSLRIGWNAFADVGSAALARALLMIKTARAEKGQLLVVKGAARDKALPKAVFHGLPRAALKAARAAAAAAATTGVGVAEPDSKVICGASGSTCALPNSDYKVTTQLSNASLNVVDDAMPSDSSTRAADGVFGVDGASAESDGAGAGLEPIDDPILPDKEVESINLPVDEVPADKIDNMSGGTAVAGADNAGEVFENTSDKPMLRDEADAMKTHVEKKSVEEKKSGQEKKGKGGKK